MHALCGCLCECPARPPLCGACAPGTFAFGAGSPGTSAQVSATSNEQRLRYDIILGSLGARYGSYCANLSRTLLVDPSKQQEAEYKWAPPLLLLLMKLMSCANAGAGFAGPSQRTSDRGAACALLQLC